jgi:nicotinate phosphoribosyltransferase
VGRALLTDLYELRMAASFRRRGMHAAATFSLFVRTLPPGRGFLVACGLEPCLEYLDGLAVTDDDLVALSALGFGDAGLEALRGLRFTGDVWAVPEGRLVFAGEPLLEVTAPIAEAQLVETFLLNQLTFATAVASKAARCRLAAGDAGLVDFAFRRTHGVEAAMAVARSSAIVGFGGTSNVEAARRFGLTAVGTMAHSYVEAFATEEAAFRAFAEEYPDDPVLLVDTYDAVIGIRTAIDVIRDMGLGDRAGIRIDSGDLLALSVQARQMLDQAGLTGTRIFASGGLDELAIEDLRAAGAPIDAYGVGTKMGVSEDAPSLESVYKLVAYDGRPVMKLSPGKATAPGAKQVFRGPDGDTIGLRDEPTPPGTEPLLAPVMQNGTRVDAREPLESARHRFRADLAALPAAARRLRDPVAPRVRFSPEAEALTRAVGDALGGRDPTPGV